MDEAYKVAITRLGNGYALAAGYPPRGGRSFPPGGDVSEAEFWAGLLDDAGRHADHLSRALLHLFLSTGRGALGSTMAASSGCVLADVIAGRPARE